MRIVTDFDIIPDDYAKHAPAVNKIDGRPVISFPFTIADLPDSARFLHWELVDPDSIPVCGFQWNHWTAANVPVEALNFDAAAHTVSVPADFSRNQPRLAPQAVQGRTSAASKLVNATDPRLTQRYNGPAPPDRAHDYVLRVWATAEPLPGLHEGYWLNALVHALRNHGGLLRSPANEAIAYLPGQV